jgi:hypothetical protein
MVEQPSEEGGGAPAERPEPPVVRRHRKRRLLAIAALSLVLLLLVVVAAVWIARRPIASDLLRREFERRGVQSTYTLDRVGLRTQQIRNLVIGDPANPDLTARVAQVQLRVTWDGSVEVYRIVARGVRLQGQLRNGRVSWGQIDKLLPPPSDKPFELPNFVVDIADSSISLATPFGRVGIAIHGSGNLTGGFEGRAAVASQRLTPGRCRLSDLKANVALEVKARRPRVEGPVALDRLVCPDSAIELSDPRLNVDARFNESFTRYEGQARLAAQQVIAGANGLANLSGNLTFRGNPEEVAGTAELAAQRSRLASIVAERTRLEGQYEFGMAAGTMAFAGDYAVDGATVPQSLIRNLTDPLRSVAETPIGPIATSIGDAIARMVRNFDSSGELRVTNGAGGGAVRIASAVARGPAGGTLKIAGGDGVTYQWPSGQIRLDGDIEVGGGGLPTGRISLDQPSAGGPISGVADFAPYSAGGSRIALSPIRFRAAPDGTTQFSTTAQLDGAFPDGRVRGLRLPIDGRLGPAGRLTIARSCITLRFDQLVFRDVAVNRDSLTICPTGEAIVVKPANGELRIGARLVGPDISGRLGRTPIRVAADSASFTGKEFVLDDVLLRLGQPDSPIAFRADRLQGTFRGSGISGTLTDAEGTIGKVPLRISDATGTWEFRGGDLHIDGGVTVSDQADPPRFYPLRSRNFSFVLSGDDIRAGGTLRHPASGTPVTEVTIRHDLQSGAGQAVLDVPGLTFGEGLQPEELTRLTEGVVALVQGTITGQGRINWSGEGEVTSTGEFSTVETDLAAPFGPVEDLTTTIRFTDLLGLETAPGQVGTVGSINPGILVENGTIRYQILANQRVKIERGEWPFMGGRLVLQETVLDFGQPSAKRLTFQVTGLDAMVFINSLGVEGLEIGGIFDGVLPMIFDESGSRIAGGRLDARPPGGHFAYTGTKPEAGLVAGLAFDLLSHIRYRTMSIGLDGDLAGEFATRFGIGGIQLNEEGGFVSGLVRGAFRKVPLKVNINITGPFRALIQMAKGFEDPTQVIEPVMPFPLDTPGIVTETRRIERETDQTSNAPSLDEQVDVSTNPPESER